MARTSGAVGGIAARVAGERVFGIKTDRAAHAEDLRAILGGLKGPLMKVAQFLSTVPDALPAEYAEELARAAGERAADGLELRPPAHGERARPGLGAQVRRASAARRRRRRASARCIARACRTAPTSPASCNTPTWRARWRPICASCGWRMAIYHRMDNAIQNEEIYKELAERLREELDYEREAAQMRLYGIMLDGRSRRCMCRCRSTAICTKRLLTMTWLDGRPLMERLREDPPQEERNRIAEALFRAWYVPFYRYGVIHGDPHLGNYQVRADGSVNLLDFGAIRVFQPRFVRGVIDLYEAVRDGDDAKAHHAYETWGFTNLTREKMDVLNMWARFLYEPLIEDRVRRIQETNDPQYGREVAERVHAGLKRTGGVRPPREFVLMDRSAIGLGGVFLRLARGAELEPAVPRPGCGLRRAGAGEAPGRRARRRRGAGREVSVCAWALVQRGGFSRSRREENTIAPDADVLAWVRARVGEQNYSDEINHLLRRRMLETDGKAG